MKGFQRCKKAHNIRKRGILKRERSMVKTECNLQTKEEQDGFHHIASQRSNSQLTGGEFGLSCGNSQASHKKPQTRQKIIDC